MQSVPATQLSIPLPPSSPYQNSSLLPHAKLCVHLSLWILQSRKPHKRIRVDSQVSFVLTPSQISTWLPKRIQPSVSPELQLKQLAASSWKLLLLVPTCRMKVWSHPHLVHGCFMISSRLKFLNMSKLHPDCEVRLWNSNLLELRCFKGICRACATTLFKRETLKSSAFRLDTHRKCL